MHNADRIPWELLRQHVELFPPPGAVRVGKKKTGKGGKKKGTADEQAQWGKKKSPAFDEAITTIANAMAEALEHDVQLERAKYTVASQRPKRGDVIVSDEIALQITPLVNFWRTKDFAKDGYESVLRKSRKQYARWQRFGVVTSKGDWIDAHNEYEDMENEDMVRAMTKLLTDPRQHRLCTHNTGFQCGCPFPLSERRVRAFTRLPPPSDCYEFQAEKPKEFFGCLVMQSLIVTGRLEPFYLLGHRHSNFKEWEQGESCRCVDTEHGWGFFLRACQSTYIATNFMLALTDHLPASEKQGKAKNYRNSHAWKRLSTELQSDMQADAFDGVFREFLARDKYHTLPFDDYNIADYIPVLVSESVSDTVRSILRCKGLPNETSNHILEYVGTRANFSIRCDPLHSVNRRALNDMLDLLWNVIVRCTLLKRKLERSLDRSAEGKRRSSENIRQDLTSFANAVYETPARHAPKYEDYLDGNG